QRHVLPDALQRARRDAAPNSGLQHAVRGLQPDLFAWSIRVRAVTAPPRLRGNKVCERRREGDRQGVGRRARPRVDAALAAAVPQLRDPTGSPLMSNNAKTALILASIALTFFVGMVIRHWLW